MSALINRMQPYKNPNPSFSIEKLDFTDYRKLNLVKNESLIGKYARLDTGKQALLIAAILISQPNKFLAAPMSLNEHSQFDFRQAQIPPLPASPRFDSRLFYVISTSENKIASKAKLEAEFNELADRWENETAIHSSPGSTYLHKDYISIMAKGSRNKEAIVPLILKRLPNAGSDYFFALQYIAGENPAKYAKDFNGAIKAWHDWANQNGFIKDENEVAAS